MIPTEQWEVLNCVLSPLRKSQSKIVALTLQAIAQKAHHRPDVRLTSKTKGHRLSLLTVDHLFFHAFFDNQNLSLAFLIQNIPPPNPPILHLAKSPLKRGNSKVIDGQLIKRLTGFGLIYWTEPSV